MFSFVKLFYIIEQFSGRDDKTLFKLFGLFHDTFYHSIQERAVHIEKIALDFYVLLLQKLLLVAPAQQTERTFDADAHLLFDKLKEIHRIKNDLQFSEEFLDRIHNFYLGRRSIPLEYCWSFTAEICSDIVQRTSSGWRGRMKQKMKAVAVRNQSWASLFGLHDASAVKHYKQVSSFIKRVALRSPFEEASADFCQMLIEFMLFAAAHVHGVDLSCLRLPEVNLAGQLREREVLPFGRTVTWLKPLQSDEISKPDFFIDFVIDNLLHINDIRKKKLGAQIYCGFMIQSVTVVQAFSNAFRLDLELFSILLESYFIPVLDDCLNSIENCESDDIEVFCKSGEFFLCRFIDFAMSIGEQEAIKKSLSFVIRYLRDHKTPDSNVGYGHPKKAQLVVIRALAEVFPSISSILDYRDRDSLVGSVLFVLGQCTALMDDSMNCYFSHSDPQAIAEVFVVLDLFKSTADLVASILKKSFVLLTEDVAQC